MAVTQREVEAELRQKNKKDIFELPEEMRVLGAPVRIYNIGPWRHQKSMGSYGQWVIHPCEEGQEYSIATEVPYVTNDPVALDMFQMAHRHDSGRKVAADILGIGQFHSPGEDLRPWGVFIAKGEKPTEDEILNAQAALSRKFDELINEADSYWNQGPQAYVNITDMHRLAARRRGQMDKPWARGIQEMASCDICGSQVNPRAAICPACKTVLDEEKVIAARVPGYEYLWASKSNKKRRPGTSDDEEGLTD